VNDRETVLGDQIVYERDAFVARSVLSMNVGNVVGECTGAMVVLCWLIDEEPFETGFVKSLL
jgi:hypothetical protein